MGINTWTPNYHWKNIGEFKFGGVVWDCHTYIVHVWHYSNAYVSKKYLVWQLQR